MANQGTFKRKLNLVDMTLLEWGPSSDPGGYSLRCWPHKWQGPQLGYPG